jgi:AcrR family transcriptional regulator
MSAPGTARPGGRTARTTAAVFASTIGELSARPYSDISVESIAARAGVHKTTVYRRWGSKAELVAQALASAAAGAIEIPDTGRVESDLRALSRSVGAVLGDPRGALITRGLLAGAAESAEIGALMDQFWATRLAAISVIVDRAAGRGEIPRGTDAAEFMHAMAAPLYYRLLVTREPVSEQDADQAAAAAVAAARAGVFTPPGRPGPG